MTQIYRALRNASIIAVAAWGTTLYENPVEAAYYDGNGLLEVCEGLVPQGATMYAIGIIDYAQIIAFQSEIASSICVPQDVTGGQVRDVVCNYLRGNPQNRHWDAAALAHNALSSAFPCP